MKDLEKISLDNDLVLGSGSEKALFKLHHINNYNIVRQSPIVKKERKLTDDERFKNLLINGITQQIEFLEMDINGIPKKPNSKRWYKIFKRNKEVYCYIKYQNKSLVLNGGDAFLVKDLTEARDFYINLKKEIEENTDFLKYLFNLSRKMKIATGTNTPKHLKA